MSFAKKKKSKMWEDSWPDIGYLTQSSVLRGPKSASGSVTIIIKHLFTDSVLIQDLFIYIM